MFHLHAEPTEPSVIFFLLVAQFSFLRLLVGKFKVLVVLVVSLVRAVRVHSRSFRQRRTLPANAQVMAAARMRRGCADNPALPRHDIFVLQSMALLFAGVVRLL